MSLEGWRVRTMSDAGRLEVFVGEEEEETEEMGFVSMGEVNREVKEGELES